MEIKPNPKLLAVAEFAYSGTLFERRPLGLPSDLPQGFDSLAGVPRCAKSAETTRWKLCSRSKRLT